MLGRTQLLLCAAVGAVVVRGFVLWRRKSSTVVTGMRVFAGCIVHSKDFAHVDVLENHLLGVTAAGRVAFLVPESQYAEKAAEFGFTSKDVRRLERGQMVMPGMIDTHAHAPQYVFAGNGMDLPLLDWLQKYTFPAEAHFSDIKHARDVYTKAVNRIMRYGTTTCAYFGTIHRPATVALAEIVRAAGQRAFVGKVCMDSLKFSPPFLCEKTEESLHETAQFVSDVRALGDPLVQPIITPRFVPTSTEELLQGLGDLAHTHDVHIQSHVSENIKEVELVTQTLFPGMSYCAVYDRARLLTRKTVLAHGVYLTDEELDLLAERGTGVSHCPYSNCGIMSGILDVFKVRSKNVKLGLGTDVAGGCNPSIIENIRMAVLMSKARSFSHPGAQVLTVDNAFYLATAGGAAVLALENEIGDFAVGKAFDALVVDLKVHGSPVDTFEADTARDMFEKFIYLSDDRNIVDVYVNGRNVTPSSAQECVERA